MESLIFKIFVVFRYFTSMFCTFFQMHVMNRKLHNKHRVKDTKSEQNFIHYYYLSILLPISLDFIKYSMEKQ